MLQFTRENENHVIGPMSNDTVGIKESVSGASGKMKVLSSNVAAGCRVDYINACVQETMHELHI